jgi:hypothetical protein
MVLVSQNWHILFVALNRKFYILVFHKTPYLSRNSYEYESGVLPLYLYDAWIFIDSSNDVINWDTPVHNLSLEHLQQGLVYLDPII